MLVENFNRRINPMLGGYYPSKYPLKASSEIYLNQDTQYLIFVSFIQGKGEFKLFTTLNQNRIELISFTDSGFSKSKLRQVVDGEEELVEWTNSLQVDKVQYVIQFTGESVRVFTRDGVILQEEFLIKDNFTLSLFNVSDGYSDSVLQSIRVIEGEYSDDQINKFILDGLFEVRYSTPSIKRACLIDLNQSGMSFDRWESNDFYLFSDNSLNIDKSNYIQAQHGNIVGLNPYRVLHRPKETSTIGYSRELTKEMIVKPIMTGISNIGFHKALFNKSGDRFSSIEEFTLPEICSIFVLFWAEEEGDIVSIGEVSDDSEEISFDNNGDWILLTLIRNKTDYTVYCNNTNCGVISNVDNPSGLLKFNSVGCLSYVKVVRNIVSLSEIEEILKAPFDFNFAAFDIVNDFDYSNIKGTEWGDSKSSITLYGKAPLNVVTMPASKGVGKLDYKNIVKF